MVAEKRKRPPMTRRRLVFALLLTGLFMLTGLGLVVLAPLWFAPPERLIHASLLIYGLLALVWLPLWYALVPRMGRKRHGLALLLVVAWLPLAHSALAASPLTSFATAPQVECGTVQTPLGGERFQCIAYDERQEVEWPCIFWGQSEATCSGEIHTNAQVYLFGSGAWIMPLEANYVQLANLPGATRRLP